MNSHAGQNRDDAIVNPIKGKNSPNLGPVAAMVCSRDDLRFLCTLMNLDDENRSHLYMSRLYVTDSSSAVFSVTGPFVGAPYAVMLLETLVAWGARKIIVLGLCGAISPTVQIGDIIIPTCSIIDEGTSKHYLTKNTCNVRPSNPIVEKTKAVLRDGNLAFHEGTVWSTDAIFRETREKVEFYQEKNVLAVEMETSALFTVGQYRDVDVGGILVVSDELSTLTWRPGFKEPHFKKSREAACEVVKRLCRMI